VVSTNVFPPADNSQQIRRGFEALWGPSRWLTPDGLSAERFGQVLAEDNALICIDLWNANLEAVEWMWEMAHGAGNRTLLVSKVLGLVKEDVV
jgi:hypothetical protein